MASLRSRCPAGVICPGFNPLLGAKGAAGKPDGRGPGPVPRGLRAHHGRLRTREDVRSAPDGVLFEALGLSSVESSGGLGFMRRELWVHSRVADNWGPLS